MHAYKPCAAQYCMRETERACPCCHLTLYCSEACRENHLEMHALVCSRRPGLFACSLCRRTDANNIFRCSRCCIAFYCCADHQRSHWRAHRSTCRPFAEAHPDLSPTPAGEVQKLMRFFLVGPAYAWSLTFAHPGLRRLPVELDGLDCSLIKSLDISRSGVCELAEVFMARMPNLESLDIR
jgi:hypothetical protein